MELLIRMVKRKVQVVESVFFEKQTQIWEIAQWIKAHKVDSDVVGCEFIYTVSGETKGLYVKRGAWVVREEAGFATYSETDFLKKFV